MEQQPITFREKKSIKNEYGDWTCLCGNNANMDGFFPCDETGREVEPTYVDWRTNLYVCAQCNRLIDVDTAEIRGRGRFIALGGIR